MAKRHIRLSALGTAATVVTATATVTALAQPPTAHADATTVSVDNLRTGWDSSEPGLGPAAITSSSFGRIFSTDVVGQVYAQPIVAGGTLVVATEENNVYGLDPATGAVAWQLNLGPAWKASAVSCGDLTPSIGVTSSPVYDPSTGTVYLTSKTYSGGNLAAAHWYMHALDAATGQERPDWPVEIQGSPDNDPDTPFDAFHQMQRPGLLLMNGVVYAGFGGHCDYMPYRGFVVGVDTVAGRQTAMWTDEAGGVSSGAGIWQAGSGLMSDGDGRIFFSTGNGMSPHSSPEGGGVGSDPPDTLGESVVRLQVNPDRTLSAADYFSPSDNATLDINDTDLGSGGPVGLPAQYFHDPAGRHLLVEQGKDGRVFVLDRDDLGGMAQGPGGTDDVVSVSGPYFGQWGHPAVWGGDGGWVYSVGNGGPMRAFRYGASSGTPRLTAVGATVDQFSYTSGSPVVTSDGVTSGSAAVWVVHSSGPTGANAELRAYNPVPNPDGTLQVLYSAPIGTAAKFVVPATDKGRVYIGTRDGKVLGFGSPTTASLTAPQTSFGQQAVGTTGSATVTVKATRALKVTGAKTSSPIFGVDTSSLKDPVALAAGDTLQLPVTFLPGAPGAVSAILSVQTDVDGVAGSVGVSLTGTGTRDGLGSNPPAVAFDSEQPTGISATLPLRIVNTGTTDETIGTVTGPSGPYTASGLPTPGSVLAPGEGVDVSVTWNPTTAGPATDSIVITSTSGNATHDSLTIPLSGTAVDGIGHLTLTPPTVDFGDVPLGTTVQQRVTLLNDGNIPLTISKAKAPAGVFSSNAPFAEGTVVGPEQTVTAFIQFTPTAPGPATDHYEITATTGQGAMNVSLTGNGVAAPPPPPGDAGANAKPPAGGNPTVSRLSGNDRYLTGVAVSQAQWANANGDTTGRTPAHGVVLARGDMFPDALSGVPLSAKVHGPLLLTDPKTLTKATEDEIHRVLGTTGTVDILGGESAVSPAVEARLRSLGYTVTRYSGADRDATALDIARRGLGDPSHIVLATGLDYADALAAGPFAAGPAAANGTPAAILPTDGKTLDPRVATYVRSKATGSTPSAPKVWAVGGQAGTASTNVGGFVQVYAGADRYETDAKLVRAATGTAPNGVPRIGIATGAAFPDALTGGAYAANAGAQLVTIASTLDAQTLALLQQLQPALISVSIFGGPNVIPAAIVDQVTKAVKGKAG